MPLIHVHILKGRSQAMKAAFSRSVTDAAVEHLKVGGDQVRVLVHEIEPEHWFVAGESKAPFA